MASSRTRELIRNLPAPAKRDVCQRPALPVEGWLKPDWRRTLIAAKASNKPPILTDENMKGDTPGFFCAQGFQVIRASHLFIDNTPDATLFEFCRREGLLLFTQDTGFERHYDLSKSPGIVLLPQLAENYTQAPHSRTGYAAIAADAARFFKRLQAENGRLRLLHYRRDWSVEESYTLPLPMMRKRHVKNLRSFDYGISDFSAYCPRTPPETFPAFDAHRLGTPPWLSTAERMYRQGRPGVLMMDGVMGDFRETLLGSGFHVVRPCDISLPAPSLDALFRLARERDYTIVTLQDKCERGRDIAALPGIVILPDLWRQASLEKMLPLYRAAEKHALEQLLKPSWQRPRLLRYGLDGKVETLTLAGGGHETPHLVRGKHSYLAQGPDMPPPAPPAGRAYGTGFLRKWRAQAISLST